MKQHIQQRRPSENSDSDVTTMSAGPRRSEHQPLYSHQNSGYPNEQWQNEQLPVNNGLHGQSVYPQMSVGNEHRLEPDNVEINPFIDDTRPTNGPYIDGAQRVTSSERSFRNRDVNKRVTSVVTTNGAPPPSRTVPSETASDAGPGRCSVAHDDDQRRGQRSRSRKYCNDNLPDDQQRPLPMLVQLSSGVYYRGGSRGF